MLITELPDLRTPRSDRVDPDTCPVCAKLRAHVTGAIKDRNGIQASLGVRALHIHTFQGHPNDPRNARKRPAG